MGKNKHSKDRMFITATEWKQEYGGKKNKATSGVRTLPFNCCALSMSEFETPVCTKEGVIFDLDNILPFLEEHKIYLDHILIHHSKIFYNVRYLYLSLLLKFFLS